MPLIINQKGQFNSYILDTFTTTLDYKSLKNLEKALVEKSEILEPVSSCFEPHHALI